MNMRQICEQLLTEEEQLRKGGGERGQERQRRLGRLPVRERLALLLDQEESFFELNLWAAWNMYAQWGQFPAAGVVTGIGNISGHACMVIANDATVKAGALVPQSVKKILRAQRIAYECCLPIIYLVDSSGVFLPMQDEIFPDEDDFGRIFRNNAVLSAAGIPQFAAIMGHCIAGGGYLPVLCDQLVMTEGSGLYLAGPALVKVAIGQQVDPEELGGARMHAAISGTVDFLEKDDPQALLRLRTLVELLPKEPHPLQTTPSGHFNHPLYQLEAKSDVRLLLELIADEASLQEYKAEWGKTLVTAYGKVGGVAVGFVANQRVPVRSAAGEIEIGGVLYPESADKAARFVMECNQGKLPLIFLQDVVGFMVGAKAEQAGIIRRGAKLVNAVSNSVVPKITVVTGNSFGAGNYALCGKAYDPNFILAWPAAKYAVMGADQAVDTLIEIQKSATGRQGGEVNPEIYETIRRNYQEQIDIRYGAARGWVDAIIAPHETRSWLIRLLQLVQRRPLTTKQFHTGVLQV